LIAGELPKCSFLSYKSCSNRLLTVSQDSGQLTLTFYIFLFRKGYLIVYPAGNWNWISAVMDGTIPFVDLCRWIDESYEATRKKTGNQKTPLPERK